jgi:hypothetical protein
VAKWANLPSRICSSASSSLGSWSTLTILKKMTIDIDQFKMVEVDKAPEDEDAREPSKVMDH